MLRELGRVTLEAGELENWLSLLVLMLAGEDPWDWQAAGHDLVSKNSADQLRKRLRALAPKWPSLEADILGWEQDVRASFRSGTTSFMAIRWSAARGRGWRWSTETPALGRRAFATRSLCRGWRTTRGGCMQGARRSW